MTEFVHDRKRAITNTVVCSVFLLMSVAVMLTRQTWWATALMALVVLWAIGGVFINARAISRGYPAGMAKERSAISHQPSENADSSSLRSSE